MIFVAESMSVRSNRIVPRKSLSTEETFAVDLTTLEQCEEKLEELFQDLMADLAQKESTRDITKIFVKLKFKDFTRTTAERAGLAPTLEGFRSLLDEAYSRTGKPVRLIGVGVRFAETAPEDAQMDLLCSDRAAESWAVMLSEAKTSQTA